MQNSESKSGKRAPRKLYIHARVVSCVIPNAPNGSTFGTRRVMYCSLTCTHVQRRVAHRRFLVGEKMVCEQCSRAARQTQVPLPLSVMA